MVPLMGGISGLFARTLADVPYVENVRRGVPVDTTKKAGRAYVDVADGPNVYKVCINAAGNVLFNDDFQSINGDADGSFRPQSFITRQEVAAVLKNERDK